MNIYKATLTIYEELFRQSTLNTSFVCRMDRSARKTLFKFCFWFKDKYTPEQRTVNLLVQYFEFQFSRYSGGYSRNHGKNKIMLTWLVGKKAIGEWETRDVRRKWFVRIKLNEEVGLRLQKAFRNERAEKAVARTLSVFNNMSDIEETAKQRFYNTVEGYLYCDMMTTLYNPQSKWCKGCEHAEECTERLRQMYPKLYNSRING